MATIAVLADISTAPTAGESTMPRPPLGILEVVRGRHALSALPRALHDGARDGVLGIPLQSRGETKRVVRRKPFDRRHIDHPVLA